MKVIFTDHAKERMKLRVISESIVRGALINPDSLEVGYDGKSLVFKKVKKGVIKVVFTQIKDTYIIISVIWHLINKK